jgi:hypothetical protein
LPYLTLTLTLTFTLTLGSLSYPPVCYPVVYVWTLGIGVAGISFPRRFPSRLRGACRDAYLDTNRAEISRLLRFGEFSPLRRLANTCYYVLRFRGPKCYSGGVI